MNLDEAKDYAEEMSYTEAIINVTYGKGIKYRKATMVKLSELSEIADKLDKAGLVFCKDCKWFDSDENESASWNLCTRHVGKHISVSENDFCSFAERKGEQ